MFDNVNEILLTITVILAASAVAFRLLRRASRVEWIKRFLTWLLEYVDVGLSALVIALVVRSCIVEPFKIPSRSMQYTLLVGDHLFVNRFLYGLRVPGLESRPLMFRTPQRGDVIVFIPPHQRDKDFIKRVIGVPGDRVEINRQAVYVNGKKLKEPYVIHKDPRGFRRLNSVRDDMAMRVVPPKKYFVMGDNRDESEDSRFWDRYPPHEAFVALADIKGKAIFIYFSWNHDPRMPAYNLIKKIRWKRLGKGIH